MKYLLQTGLLLFLNAVATLACATTTMTEIKINYPIKSPFYPVVLKGDSLPILLGNNTHKISVWRADTDSFIQIPYQIDKVDDEGTFELVSGTNRKQRNDSEQLDGNDEIVLMASDLGKRLAQNMSLPPHENLVEVELLDPHSNTRGWFYILITKPEPASKMKSSTRYVHYDSTHDLIETDTYTVGFSSKTPFLADRLQWFLGDDKGFSEDVIDTMKIRHKGKLFHFLPFERTHGDYSSKLVAVKEGPVRIIRRTANKIRIVLGIGSPAVYIDQIIYRNTFVMDIIVDVPFRIGAVFSDLTAVPTIDGLVGPDAPITSIHSESNLEGVQISGEMTDLKRAFNNSGDKILAISNELGLIVADIAARDDAQIETRTYLVDDESLLDSPEEVPGQHGNTGFMMTGWDRLDNQIHHILYRSYLVQGVSVADGIALIKNSPQFH